MESNRETAERTEAHSRYLEHMQRVLRSTLEPEDYATKTWRQRVAASLGSFYASQSKREPRFKRKKGKGWFEQKTPKVERELTEEEANWTTSGAMYRRRMQEVMGSYYAHQKENEGTPDA